MARVLPAPLRAFVGKPPSALAWHDRAPGIVVARLTTVAEQRVGAVLIRSRSGASYPVHDHTGVELAIALTGGWSDEYGHFLRGDLSVREPGEPHLAIIDDGEDCLAFSVVDEALVPRG